MPVNYNLIAAAVNTLQERMFSLEFQELELFRNHPEWLTQLYTELSGMITRTLGTAALEESETMTEIVTYEVNALLDQARFSSELKRKDTDFGTIFHDIKVSFCPRFPIC